MNIPNLPEPIEPEYMSWSLTKLQGEYRNLNMKYLSQQIRNADEDERVKKAEALVEAIQNIIEAKGTAL